MLPAVSSTYVVAPGQSGVKGDARAEDWGEPTARSAGSKAAELAFSPMPALQEVRGVKPTLLTPRLLDLIGALLACPEIFENFAFTKRLLIGSGCLLTNGFETHDILVQTDAKFMQLFSDQETEVQLGARASGSKRRSVGGRGLGEVCV